MQLQFCTYFAYKFATRICTQIADILLRNGLPPKLQKALQTFLAQGKPTYPSEFLATVSRLLLFQASMNYETTLITTEGLGTELGSPPRKLFRCYLSANQRAQNGELSGLLHTRRYHSNTIRRRYLQTPPVGRKIILGVKFPLALPRLPLH